MSRVLVNGLNVRAGPSIGSQSVAHYDAGQMINSGNAIILNEGRKWLRYTGSSGNQRYVCAINNDGSRYVDYPPNLPMIPPPCCPPPHPMPLQTQFPDPRIQKWGGCFLCTCVKGGLTTMDQCMQVFHLGLKEGKLRQSDCYVQYNKEAWAQEIAERFGTTYHPYYIFQANNRRTHFWLTSYGREIYNPFGIGWHG